MNIEPDEARDDERVIRFCHGSPREFVELASMLAGCNVERDDLDDADAVAAFAAAHVLWRMVREGKLVRQAVADPRYDLYGPPGGRKP